jgi:hypothetical protein
MAKRTKKGPPQTFGVARPVDQAMAADRPEKGRVRSLWIEKLVAYDEEFPNEPLYLSLTGAEGRDIKLLIEQGVIETTEIGAIAAHHVDRIAAVEYNLQSVASLQRLFPGLQIFNQPFQSVIKGELLTRYPDGRHEKFCRARVINLDLNGILATADEPGSFPILAWIQKLGEMHARRPRVEWCLCLTLHGELNWDADTSGIVQQFLQENFKHSAEFAERSRAVLGDELYDSIVAANPCDFASLEREQQQRLLLVFVPKKIAQLLSGQAWRMVVPANLRYGQPEHAPMVTWIMEFRHVPSAAGTPQANYLRNINGALAAAGSIDPAGEIIVD